MAVPGRVVADVLTVWTWLNMEGLGEACIERNCKRL